MGLNTPINMNLDNVLVTMNIEDTPANANLDDTLERLRKEKKYVDDVATREIAFLKEYNWLRNDKEKAKYINELVKKGEYFSAYKAYTSKIYTGHVGNKERIVMWADKLVEKLFDDGVPGLIPIYTTIMYMIGGLKREEIIRRLEPKLEKRGIDSAKRKVLIEWHPVYRK
ncbi:Uncharacterised protein [Candidatus Tiddalikarchaeum anstoanum]|nr:Uncharacterised protein [Candidatus Tiddalikarchaeum anstoanum]